MVGDESQPPGTVKVAWRDPVLWVAVILGWLLRAAPLWIWRFGGCQRDECMYETLAEKIVAGEGLVAPKGWLWAPGYPYVLAAFESVFGGVRDTVPWMQVWAGALGVALAFLLTERVTHDRRSARIAGFLIALHPTLIYYAGRLWSEAIYAPLLLGAVLALLWARDGRSWRGVLPGVLVGCGVLLRGVATYMAPIFILAAVWPRSGETPLEGVRKRWVHGAAFLAGALLMVAPYSIGASIQHGGFVVSDATLGQMMYLGNNDFPPASFDYGNGLLRNRVKDLYFEKGRAHCSEALAPARWDACERDNGMSWIAANPATFVRRIPIRVSQMLHPHTFLSRHIRWGKWDGMPWWVKETVCVWVVVWSYLVIIGGTLAAWARARGPFGLLAVGIVGYHVLAIAMLAGLSRYRLPLEPLWIVFLAGLLARPSETWRGLLSTPARAAGVLITLPALLVLVSRFLLAGFPGFW